MRREQRRVAWNYTRTDDNVVVCYSNATLAQHDSEIEKLSGKWARRIYEDHILYWFEIDNELMLFKLKFG